MTAVLATFVNAKPIPTRSVLQLIFEVKIEDADAAMKALGGYPLPAESRWVGIALSPKARAAETKKDKRAWDQLSPTEQAGILCLEPEFQAFMMRCGLAKSVENTGTADWVRLECGVTSRSELNTNEAAANRWRQLELQYQQYLTDRRYAESRR